MYQFNRKEYEERMKWYQDARFGMFIHWGLYSIHFRRMRIVLRYPAGGHERCQRGRGDPCESQ